MSSTELTSKVRELKELKAMAEELEYLRERRIA